MLGLGGAHSFLASLPPSQSSVSYCMTALDPLYPAVSGRSAVPCKGEGFQGLEWMVGNPFSYFPKVCCASTRGSGHRLRDWKCWRRRTRGGRLSGGLSGPHMDRGSFLLETGRHPGSVACLQISAKVLSVWFIVF